MINLYVDVFVQLALAAKRQKEKEVEKSEEIDVSPYDFGNTYRPQPVEKVAPIEDTVYEILNNPEVIKLKKELDTVEKIFNKLKNKGENMDYLSRLESRILRLRQVLDEQSF
jgi:hypothetical protein